jgi:hypothetical protein
MLAFVRIEAFSFLGFLVVAEIELMPGSSKTQGLYRACINNLVVWYKLGYPGESKVNEPWLVPSSSR